MEPELATVLDLATEKTTTPISPLLVARLPATEMEMVVESRDREESSLAPSERREH